MNNEPEQTTGNRPDWDSIKGEYLEGQASLRQLARTRGVSFHTLGKRAKRERWALQRRQLGDAVATTVATKAIEMATAEGERIGMAAAEFEQRILTQVFTWIERLDKAASRENPNVQEIRVCVAALRDLNAIGRETYGLDEPEQPRPCALNVLVLGRCQGLPPLKQATTQPGDGQPEPDAGG